MAGGGGEGDEDGMSGPTVERSEGDMEAQQMRGLREAGYPSLASPTPAADPPAVIVERQARLRSAFAEIHAHQPHQTPRVAPGPAGDVMDDELNAWVALDPFVRESYTPAVAQALAYLERFKR